MTHFIDKNMVAVLDFELKDEDGNVIDSSRDGGEVLSYIHGVGMMIPALETELAGKKAGEKVNTVIQAESAYGHRNPDLVQQVERSQLSGVDDLHVGMQLEADDGEGVSIVTITEIGDEKVTIDGNHPLAGADLHFDINIIEVRAATAEELDHGHVHGEGGHHH